MAAGTPTLERWYGLTTRQMLVGPHAAQVSSSPTWRPELANRRSVLPNGWSQGYVAATDISEGIVELALQQLDRAGQLSGHQFGRRRRRPPAPT